MYLILAINPGSTSTKLSIFENTKEIVAETIYHQESELQIYNSSLEQFEYRFNLVKNFIYKSKHEIEDFSAFVGRGGVLPPLPGGTYLVNEEMIYDLYNNTQADHPSNLGGIIAYELTRKVKSCKIPLALVVDPVSVDEFEPVAYISGIPEIKRKCLSHSLNMKAVVREACQDLKIDYDLSRFVVAHLGSGISISPMVGGRIIDVNNANEGGPFSCDRAGALPTVSLVNLCYSGKYSKDELIKKLTTQGGLFAHLGTKDLKEVEERICEGDEKAKLIYDAMVYQISKEIGAMATVINGKFDGILITGGMSRSDLLVNKIKEKISFLGKVYVYPGEEEMKALALGAYRVLKGEEKIIVYGEKK